MLNKGHPSANLVSHNVKILYLLSVQVQRCHVSAVFLDVFKTNRVTLICSHPKVISQAQEYAKPLLEQMQKPLSSVLPRSQMDVIEMVLSCPYTMPDMHHPKNVTTHCGRNSCDFLHLVALYFLLHISFSFSFPAAVG